MAGWGIAMAVGNQYNYHGETGIREVGYEAIQRGHCMQEEKRPTGAPLTSMPWLIVLPVSEGGTQSARCGLSPAIGPDW